VMKHFVVRSLSVLVFMIICVQTLSAQNTLPSDPTVISRVSSRRLRCRIGRGHR